MIFDVFLLKLNGEIYCYDIQGGAIIKVDQLHLFIMKNFHLRYKDIIKKKDPQYSAREVSEAHKRIQDLVKNGTIHPLSLRHTIFDHSNIIQIKKVVCQEFTDEAIASYRSLLRRMHLSEKEVELMSLDGFKPQPVADELVESTDELPVIELFLLKLRSKCFFSLKKQDYDIVSKAVLRINEKIAKSADDFFHFIKDYPTILQLLRKVFLREKKFLPCRAGINFICIDRKGRYYNCLLHSKSTALKDEELGHVVSVYDLQKCRQCFARFLCGGPCHLRRESLSDSCTLIRKVMYCILCFSSLIGDKDQNLMKWIGSVEPYVNEVFF